MDHQVAYALIDNWLTELWQRSYNDLVSLMAHTQTKEGRGEDGKVYQLEAEVFWDSKKGGNVRVIVAGDDGSFWASIKPLCTSFIMAPDGSFVGESLAGY